MNKVCGNLNILTVLPNADISKLFNLIFGSFSNSLFMMSLQSSEIFILYKWITF